MLLAGLGLLAAILLPGAPAGAAAGPHGERRGELLRGNSLGRDLGCEPERRGRARCTPTRRVRVIVTPHFAGTQLRVHFSNRFGSGPVTFATASVGRRGPGRGSRRRDEPAAALRRLAPGHPGAGDRRRQRPRQPDLQELPGPRGQPLRRRVERPLDRARRWRRDDVRHPAEQHRRDRRRRAAGVHDDDDADPVRRRARRPRPRVGQRARRARRLDHRRDRELRRPGQPERGDRRKLPLHRRPHPALRSEVEALDRQRRAQRERAARRVVPRGRAERPRSTPGRRPRCRRRERRDHRGGHQRPRPGTLRRPAGGRILDDRRPLARSRTDRPRSARSCRSAAW